MHPIRALLAPAAAVSTLGQMERVFVARRRQPRRASGWSRPAPRAATGSKSSPALADGDRVVLAPPAGLREGQMLEIQP